MQQRQCDHYWQVMVTTRAAESDIARRLEEYAAGYCDRQAEGP
ncbi:hypothetical protein [Mycobacterium fragae]|nr:hypothetical protein [Mycobacterium fragae]